MRVIVDANNDFVALKFCCANMGSAIMRHEIFMLPCTDHFPVLCIELKTADRKSNFEYMRISHCPFCGDKLLYKEVVKDNIFDDKQLIAKYGSWIKIQVAFYDFIFLKASGKCPECFNKQLKLEEFHKFVDGENLYDTSINVIKKLYSSFDAAWKAFKAEE